MRRHHCRMTKHFDLDDVIFQLEAKILGIDPTLSQPF